MINVNLETQEEINIDLMTKQPVKVLQSLTFSDLLSYWRYHYPNHANFQTWLGSYVFKVDKVKRIKK